MKEGCRINEVGMALNIVSVVVLAVWRTCKKEREDNTRKGKHTKEKKKTPETHTKKEHFDVSAGNKKQPALPYEGLLFFPLLFLLCLAVCA
jgi:FtsZ-interacting cell division protein ZipA